MQAEEAIHQVCWRGGVEPAGKRGPQAAGELAAAEALLTARLDLWVMHPTFFILRSRSRMQFFISETRRAAGLWQPTHPEAVLAFRGDCCRAV